MGAFGVESTTFGNGKVGLGATKAEGIGLVSGLKSFGARAASFGASRGGLGVLDHDCCRRRH